MEKEGEEVEDNKKRDKEEEVTERDIAPYYCFSLAAVNGETRKTTTSSTTMTMRTTLSK